MSLNDIELASSTYLPAKTGFAVVADKIAEDVDKTTTIYRRFDRLSARNILLLQAEIAELEYQQERCDAEDSKRDTDSVVINGRSDWREFVRNATKTNDNGEPLYPEERKRLDLAKQIREKLKEYHETIARHKDLLNTPPPSKNTVKAMRNWFFNNQTGAKDGDGDAQLWGASAHIYNDFHDLVALRVPAEQDRLSEFIQSNFGIFFRTSNPENGSAYISERSVSRFVAILSTILAALLLFGAIISLYFVKNEQALLGMVGGWTVLFASCVGLLTNARREQIFASTAAYAAVLVVFVSGNLGDKPSGLGQCVCQASPS